MAGEVHPQVHAIWREEQKKKRDAAIALIAQKFAFGDLERATVKYWEDAIEARAAREKSAAVVALAAARREAESLRQQLEVERRSWVPRPIRKLFAVFL
jgi:hypothetical protein